MIPNGGTSQIYLESIQRLFKEICLSFGENPDREGLVETPERIYRMLGELLKGYLKNPVDVLKTFEDGACDEMVILKNIEFYSLCEHHCLPYHGSVSIGYIPNKKVVGLSKLARVVEIYSRRLTIQEKLTSNIADCINKSLNPIGVMVITEAKHLCMAQRGVKKNNSKMITSALRGIFKEDINARQEFLTLCAQ